MFSFPLGTEMFQFPRCPSPALCVQIGDAAGSPQRVSPFGHPRIDACTPLPEAFRSVPRPSSAFGAIGIHRKPFVTSARDAEKSKLFAFSRSIQLVRCILPYIFLSALTAGSWPSLYVRISDWLSTFDFSVGLRKTTRLIAGSSIRPLDAPEKSSLR